MASTAPRTALIEGPIARTLFFFTLPILASNVLQSLNGSVNSIASGPGALWVVNSKANLLQRFDRPT